MSEAHTIGAGRAGAGLRRCRVKATDPLKVTCPFCWALPGERCYAGRRYIQRKPHVARVRAAERGEAEMATADGGGPPWAYGPVVAHHSDCPGNGPCDCGGERIEARITASRTAFDAIASPANGAGGGGEETVISTTMLVLDRAAAGLRPTGSELASVPPWQWRINWAELAPLCPSAVKPLPVRQRNALRIEVLPSTEARCLQQSPDGRGAAWFLSGGSPLAYGECRRRACPLTAPVAPGSGG